MRQKVVLVGESPLCLFLAVQLDQTLADLAHIEVIWLTREATISCLHLESTLLFERHEVDKKQGLNHVRLDNSQIKSLNLAERRIVTDRGILSYNYLALDQAPVYRASELTKIGSELTKLIAAVKAGKNTGKATTADLLVQGTAADSYQLALAIRHDLMRRQGRSISVICEEPKEGSLKAFLKEQGLKVGRGRLERPGLSIHAPTTPVNLRRLRGLKIDHQGQAMVGNSGQILHHPEVIILNEADRAHQNLLRSQKTLAERLAKSLQQLIDGAPALELETAEPAQLLNGPLGVAVWLGRMFNQRTRAKLIWQLERRLWRQLV